MPLGSNKFSKNQTPVENQENMSSRKSPKPPVPARSARFNSIRNETAPMRASPRGPQPSPLSQTIRPGKGAPVDAAPVSHERMREIFRAKSGVSLSKSQRSPNEDTREEITDGIFSARAMTPDPTAFVNRAHSARESQQSDSNRPRKLTRMNLFLRRIDLTRLTHATGSYRSPSLTSRKSSLSLNALKDSLGRSASSLRLRTSKGSTSRAMASAHCEIFYTNPSPVSDVATASRAQSRSDQRTPEPLPPSHPVQSTETTTSASKATTGEESKFRPRSLTTGSMHKFRSSSRLNRMTGRSTPGALGCIIMLLMFTIRSVRSAWTIRSTHSAPC